ncbi:MAG: hypothetical protein JNM36_07675 [Chitinophagales bacterium]|nr:hypothetical protein [Chitinophagales bacterium]
MARIFEQGHANNVSSLERLNLTLTEIGGEYQPSNEEISLVKLQSVLQDAKVAIQEVTNAITNYTHAVNNRQILFIDVKGYSTQVVNSVIASGANAKTVEDVKSINQKIQGSSTQRKTTLPTEESNNPAATTETVRQISTSQQSYEQITERFSRLVAMVSAEAKYQPREARLSREGLTAHLQTLAEANTNVMATYIALQNARNRRNAIMYAPQTGIYDLTQKIKSYIKSIYSPKDATYKQVFAIKFKNLGK